MNFMQCTTCQSIVNVNETGICLACQMQTGGIPQSDAYQDTATKKENTASLSELLARKNKIEEELAHADEIPIATQMDACQQPQNGEEMGERNPKKRKIAKKKGQKKIN